MRPATALLERLTHDHEAIRILAARFGALLVGPPPADMKPVADARWDLTKSILQHVAFEDRHAFLPLERDPRAGVAATAARFKRELEAIQTAYEGHMDRWSAAATLANWSSYRERALASNRALLDRMRREEADLFPLIDGCAEIASGATPPPAQRNWARAAWDAQDSIRGR